jgi:DNA polymerase-3 subunit alpha
MVDSVVRIKPLMKTLIEMKSPALALTDLNNFFAAVKMYKAAIGSGIKPIFGAELLLNNEKDNSKPYHLVLLCQNNIGYKNLTTLISKAYQEGGEYNVISREWLAEASDGLIALSGGVEGDLCAALLNKDKDSFEERLSFWQTYFKGNFYFEITRLGKKDEEQLIQQIIPVSEKYNIPLVATNNVRFIAPDDFYSHEARVCIHDGYVLEDDKRPQVYTKEQYLKTPEEMMALFSDIPEAIENTLEIAKRCNAYLTLGENFLPNFPIPSHTTMPDYLSLISNEGLDKRLKLLFDTDDVETIKSERPPYDERLRIELDVINSMGFSGYFLIVADFIYLGPFIIFKHITIMYTYTGLMRIKIIWRYKPDIVGCNQGNIIFF